MAERQLIQPRSLSSMMELIRPELMPAESIRQMVEAMATNDTAAGALAMGEIVDSLFPQILRDVTNALGEPVEPLPPDLQELIREVGQAMAVHFVTIANEPREDGALPQGPGQLEAKEQADGH